MQRLKIALVAAALGLAVFARCLSFDFVYDDRWTIVQNRWLERPLGELLALIATGRAVAEHVPDATRPLMVVGHWLERRVYGLAPSGYHLDSLLLYGVSCAFAASVALLVSRRRDVALFAGCFFAVAPVHAEPVAAINYREDLLAALATLGVIACVGYASRPWTSPPARLGKLDVRAGAAAALFFGGLAAKESALALLPLLGFLAWALPWVRRSLRLERRAIYLLAAVLVLYLLWRAPLAAGGEDLPLAPARPLGQTLLRAARFEVRAVGEALFPWTFSPDRWRQPDASFGWLGPFIALVAGVALLARAPRTRTPAVGVGIALLAPVVASPLLRPVNEFADRYFFLGVLGGGLFWGWVALQVARTLAWQRARYVLVLVLVPLALVGQKAVAIWRDERTLWTAATEITPSSPRAWAALARVHRLAHERDAADAAMARALATGPDYVPALVTEIYNDLAFGRVEHARDRILALQARPEKIALGRAPACAKLDAEAAAACINR